MQEPGELLITVLERALVRRQHIYMREMCKHPDCVYVQLPNGNYYLLKHPDNTIVVPIVLSKRDFLLATKNVVKSPFEIPMQWRTEDEIAAKMQTIKGKFWMHPLEGLVYQIGAYVKAPAPFSQGYLYITSIVARNDDHMLPTNAIIYGNVTALTNQHTEPSDSATFDCIDMTQKHLFFDSYQKICQALLSAWRTKHSIHY